MLNPGEPTTAYSSFRKQALLDLLREQYAIHPDELRYLKRGFNDTYLVVTGDNRFILRIYRSVRRSLEEIRGEVRLLLYLGKNGQAVSVPLPGKEEVYVHPLPAPEGMRYAVLFSFATGSMLRKPDPSQCRDAGSALGEIHEQLREFDAGNLTWDYQPGKIFTYARDSVRTTLAAYPDDLHFLDRMQEEVGSRLKGGVLKTGICHGDLQPENFYFQENHRVCFIDFDFSGRGPLLYDLGAYTWYDHRGKTPEMLKSFYAGYASRIPLSREEQELIPVFGALRALFLMGMWNSFMDGESNPVWPAEQVSAFVQKLGKWMKDLGIRI